MGGIGYNQSKGNSESESGLRGTSGFGNAVNQATNQGNQMSNFTNQMFSSPGAMLNFGQQANPSGRYGLGSNVDKGVEALGDYQFGKQSGNLAMRGQTSPENMSSVIGSSVQNMLPFLIPQMQNQRDSQLNAPLSLFEMAKQSSDYWGRTLGSKSRASQSAFGFDAKVNGAAKPFS